MELTDSEQPIYHELTVRIKDDGIEKGEIIVKDELIKKEEIMEKGELIEKGELVAKGEIENYSPYDVHPLIYRTITSEIAKAEREIRKAASLKKGPKKPEATLSRRIKILRPQATTARARIQFKIQKLKAEVFGFKNDIKRKTIEKWVKHQSERTQEHMDLQMSQKNFPWDTY